MKDLKIYSVDEIKDPLVLMLCHNGQGGVKLAAVNTQGKRVESSSLLTLAANGNVFLHKGISKDLELPLDEDGRLKIAGRKEKEAVTFSDDDLARVSVIQALLTARYRSQIQDENMTEARCVLTVFERMIEHLNLPINE